MRPTEEIPRPIRRLLRQYADAAYEEELRRALLPLAEAFRAWERREMDSSDLNDQIHLYHRDQAHNIWSRNATSSMKDLETLVSIACARDVLDFASMPPELRDFLEPLVEHLRSRLG